MRKQVKSLLPDIREIEINTAKLWLSTGAIRITDIGEENTYYENEFGHLFFCKNYPASKIESGEAVAILGIPAKPRYELLDDMECVVATADRLQDLAYASALQHNRRPMVYDTVTGKTCAVPEIENCH
jgi:hypothetical protein